MTKFLTLSAAAVWRPCACQGDGGGVGCPPYVHAQFCNYGPNFFHILISYRDYYNCTKKQPEIYVQYAKGGTYFVYIFCWSRALGRISPYENGTCFFHGRLLASKGDVWRQKVAQSSPSSYLGEGKKEKKKKTFFRGQENIWFAPSPLHQLGLVRLLKAAAVAKSNRVNKSFERRSWSKIN